MIHPPAVPNDLRKGSSPAQLVECPPTSIWMSIHRRRTDVSGTKIAGLGKHAGELLTAREPSAWRIGGPNGPDQAGTEALTVSRSPKAIRSLTARNPPEVFA